MTLGDLEGLRLGPSDALFLDLDGTLAEIVADPDAVRLPAATADGARPISPAGSAARSRSSAAATSATWPARTPRGALAARRPRARGAAAGRRRRPPRRRRCPSRCWRRCARWRRGPGLRLELKGPVAALHYRAAPDAEGDALAAAKRAAAAGDDLVWQAGKMVVEVKPAAAHKGTALRAPRRPARRSPAAAR